MNYWAPIADRIAWCIQAQSGRLTRDRVRQVIVGRSETVVNIGAGKHNRFIVVRLVSFAAVSSNLRIVVLC